MQTKAAIWGLCWEGTSAQSVVASQRWVLTAMQRHGRGLVSMLWRILGNEADVCDAYQDTFLRLAQHEDGRRPGNVKAFVYRCASNVAVSMLRRRRARQRLRRALADRSSAARVAGELDSRRLRESLRDEIARLPERLRSVVILKDLAELPYRQVAAILGVSVGTARVYRCRGVRLLAARIARRDGA